MDPCLRATLLAAKRQCYKHILIRVLRTPRRALKLLFLFLGWGILAVGLLLVGWLAVGWLVGLSVGQSVESSRNFDVSLESLFTT